MDALPLILGFAVSLVICAVLLPLYIRRAVKVKMTGTDIHKRSRPEIAEAGGIVLTLAYVLGLFSMIPNFASRGDSIVPAIIATGATVLLCAFSGLVDDVFDLPWRVKVLTPLIGGVPIAVMLLGHTEMWTPLGYIDFGILFYVLIIPIIVTSCCNAVNMLAGLNGLEAGSVFITAIGLLAASILQDLDMGIILLVPFLGALAAFIYYNRYPSRVFPGDVGTFSMGAVIASVAILAYLQRAAFVMFIPHIVNAGLFFLGKLQRRAPVRDAPLNPDGTLPTNSVWSLRNLILRIKPMTEKQAIVVVWAIVAIFAILGGLVYH
jgi:UDP-N-acetylglucosamine--dolichyl-phosphate N-acetylglucosaminephosphotransferase